MSAVEKGGSCAFGDWLKAVLAVVVGGAVTFMGQCSLSKDATRKDNIRQVAIHMPELFTEAEKCGDGIFNAVFDQLMISPHAQLSAVQALPGACRANVDKLSFFMVAFGVRGRPEKETQMLALLDQMEQDLGAVSLESLSGHGEIEALSALAEKATDFSTKWKRSIREERMAVYKFLERSSNGSFL